MTSLTGNNNNGIDLVGRNRDGEWRFIEVKGHNGAVKPSQSGKQGIMSDYASERLGHILNHANNFSQESRDLVERILQ